MKNESMMMGVMGVAIGSAAIMLAYAARRVSDESERATVPAPPYWAKGYERYDGPFEFEADTALRETDTEWSDPDWPMLRYRI